MQQTGPILDELNLKLLRPKLEKDLVEFIVQGINQITILQTSDLFKNFLFNLPALSIILEKSLFLDQICPVIFKYSTIELLGEELMLKFLAILPYVITNVLDDQKRQQMMLIITSILEKANKEQKKQMIGTILKEVPILYKEFTKAGTKEQYPSSL